MDIGVGKLRENPRRFSAFWNSRLFNYGVISALLLSLFHYFPELRAISPLALFPYLSKISKENRQSSILPGLILGSLYVVATGIGSMLMAPVEFILRLVVVCIFVIALGLVFLKVQEKAETNPVIIILIWLPIHYTLIQIAGTGNVFLKPDGTPHRGEIRKTLSSCIKRAKMKSFTFHDLRHTFASQLVMDGIDLPTVKELMGHSNISTTMIYAHLAPDHLHSAIRRLGRRLTNG